MCVWDVCVCVCVCVCMCNNVRVHACVWVMGVWDVCVCLCGPAYRLMCDEGSLPTFSFSLPFPLSLPFYLCQSPYLCLSLSAIPRSLSHTYTDSILSSLSLSLSFFFAPISFIF